MDALTQADTDPLTDLLNGVRTTGAVFSWSPLSGSWAVRFEEAAPLALAVPLHGPAWAIPDGGRPVRLDQEDVAVLSGATPYVIASDLATEPEMIIRSDGSCTTLDGQEQNRSRDLGTWDTSGPDDTLVLNGLYTVAAGAPGRLLAALPPLAVIPAEQGTCPINPAAFEDITRPAPGRQVLLDRLLDLMLIAALRSWFTRPGADVPGWYRALSDPVVGRALRLLDADMARQWTVDTLAAKAGVSRAALARRFTALVGQPPMTYLREKRITLASAMLHEPDATIGAVAARVGFSSAFALSTAFKQARGISPSEYRAGTAPTRDTAAKE
ncbi:AraC family transcriptional regulator [Streptomyces sp. NPDC002920]